MYVVVLLAGTKNANAIQPVVAIVRTREVRSVIETIESDPLFDSAKGALYLLDP
ncbi:hypothetical protein Fmac_012437 [Flemingia macrophylla]|uniref:Uncharacterized protein n=1 Tax=Flemingia macrophylla TaxID=520843 RepID=A0ABD1MQB2_9FABA